MNIQTFSEPDKPSSSSLKAIEQLTREAQQITVAEEPDPAKKVQTEEEADKPGPSKLPASAVTKPAIKMPEAPNAKVDSPAAVVTIVDSGITTDKHTIYTSSKGRETQMQSSCWHVRPKNCVGSLKPSVRN